MAGIASSQGDQESRFAHLLQPIKDLAKNWDVDLASELEDYLAEIEKITISFDGGITTMNFAEAALLIQGSACIYSRKVEYLYSLICQTLQTLGSNKKPQQLGSNTKENGGALEGTSNTDDEPFLALDDIQEHNNITLRNDDDNAANRTDVVPVTPAVLLPFGDGMLTSTPLVSRTGEIVGNRNDFRMNTSSIHTATGFVLLDPSCTLSMLPDKDMPFVRNMAGGAVSLPAADTVSAAVVEANIVDEGCDLNLSTDSDNVGPVLASDALTEAPAIEVPARQIAKPKKVTSNKQPVLNAAERYKNFWQLLDQHQPDKPVSLKPFKSGRIISMPRKISKVVEYNKTRKRKVESSQYSFKEKLTPIIDFCNSEYFSRKDRISKNPMKTLHYADFEDLYWEQVKLVRKVKCQLTNLCKVDEDEVEENEGEMEAFEADENNDSGDENAGEDGEIDANAFQIPDDVFGSAGLGRPDDLPAATGQGQNEDLSNAEVISSYEDLVRKYVDAFMSSAQQYAQETELARRVMEWQDKIKPRLEEEERRRSFDIHVYGREMIGRLDVLGARCKPTSFAKAVAGVSSVEVCRYFLSTLQLANDQNVEIACRGSLSEAVDKMTLKLLSDRQHFENLTNYQAPSLQRQSQPAKGTPSPSEPQRKKALTGQSQPRRKR